MHQEQSVLQKFLQKPCYTRKSATWKLRKLIPFLRLLSSAAGGGASSTSSEQPTKSPDICFAHNCSPLNQSSTQMILNSFKVIWGEVQRFIYYRSGEGGGTSKGDIFQPPPLWHRPLTWVDEEILVIVQLIRMMMVRKIVARGEFFLLLVVEVEDFFRSCVILWKRNGTQFFVLTA